MLAIKSLFFLAVALCIGACSREDRPSQSLVATANAPVSPQPEGASSAAQPAKRKSGEIVDEAVPRDEAFEAFGEAELSKCSLKGDYGGSNAEMAERGWSEMQCFVSAATRLLKNMPSSQRRELLGGRATSVQGNNWYDSWERFGALAGELTLRMSFTSGSFHSGGMMLVSMRPGFALGFAHEIAYWLHSISQKNEDALAKRVVALGPGGKRSLGALGRLKRDAIDYVRQQPETAIAEYYPTHMQPLYGGDWRRVIYDIRELRSLALKLSERLCRSSVKVAAMLGGPEACVQTVRFYLFAQVGGDWQHDDSVEDSDGGPFLPGMDDAYVPFAMTAYELCELDSRGTRVPYKDRLQCLKETLRSTRGESKVAQLAVRYLDALCDLELSGGVELDSPMARPFLSVDECLAIGAVRSRYFIETWALGNAAKVKEHMRTRAKWGNHVRQKLPKLEARHEQSLATPSPEANDFGLPPVTPKDHREAIAAIASTVELAGELASLLCEDASPVAAEIGSGCVAQGTDYWLSYGYFPGMAWEAEGH